MLQTLLWIPVCSPTYSTHESETEQEAGSLRGSHANLAGILPSWASVSRLGGPAVTGRTPVLSLQQ